MNSHPSPSPQAPVTRRMLLRAFLKALCLFFAFTVVYGLIRPVHNGLLPSLYNVALPGRVRFMKDYEFDAHRLVADHVVSAARSDTFNIVVVGSSEMWGIHSLADLSVPVIMDRLNLTAADGRPVRVYNLSHPVPFGLKDLVVMEAVFRRQIPVDLVILSSFDVTLSYSYPYHPIARANFPLELDVVDHYQLNNAYEFLSGIYLGRSIPVFTQLWEDRSALRLWLEMQIRALEWSITRLDLSLIGENEMFNLYKITQLYDTLRLDRIRPQATPDFLYAFKQMSREHNLPVIILSSPVPFKNNEYAPWLQTQTALVGLPLIDCWDTFRDPAHYVDEFHLTREMSGPYAYTLIAALSDPRFAAESPGLPLRPQPDFVPPSESCRVYPANAGEHEN